MVDQVVDAAVKPNSNGEKMTHLIDCYCGSGLFCLSSAAFFDVCVGIEVNEKAVEEATFNADLNNVSLFLFSRNKQIICLFQYINNIHTKCSSFVFYLFVCLFLD